MIQNIFRCLNTYINIKKSNPKNLRAFFGIGNTSMNSKTSLFPKYLAHAFVLRQIQILDNNQFDTYITNKTKILAYGRLKRLFCNVHRFLPGVKVSFIFIFSFCYSHMLCAAGELYAWHCRLFSELKIGCGVDFTMCYSHMWYSFEFHTLFP